MLRRPSSEDVEVVGGKTWTTRVFAGSDSQATPSIMLAKQQQHEMTQSFLADWHGGMCSAQEDLNLPHLYIIRQLCTETTLASLTFSLPPRILRIGSQPQLFSATSSYLQRLTQSGCCLLSAASRPSRTLCASAGRNGAKAAIRRVLAKEAPEMRSP